MAVDLGEVCEVFDYAPWVLTSSWLPYYTALFVDLAELRMGCISHDLSSRLEITLILCPANNRSPIKCICHIFNY